MGKPSIRKKLSILIGFEIFLVLLTIVLIYFLLSII
jgi:hypothetical protein